MRLGGVAAYLGVVESRQDITDALAWAEGQNIPILMIGSGSNIVWTDEGYPGLVLVNAIKRFETYTIDAGTLYVTAGAGEVWDDIVSRVVDLGYSGIERLSLIPGTTGAAPVQNIGAYGREISDAIAVVEAYDTKEKRFVTIPGFECGFGYRTSRFKDADKGRFYITAVTLHVTHEFPIPPFYPALQQYLDTHAITDYSPDALRKAVVEIRKSKMPDPKIIANCGSFFTNPIVNQNKMNLIIQDYPAMMYWHLDDGSVKLSAAWLIEQCGFKGVRDEATGMATWKDQPLVLVNEHATSTAQLLQFRQKIIDAVHAKFGITLSQEPDLLGA